eukprot:COSAG04_NODE_1047_length_8562_cov_9.403167_9_plen_67_part_00
MGRGGEGSGLALRVAPAPFKPGWCKHTGFLGTLYPPPRGATAPKIFSELGLEVLQLAEGAVDRADD